MAEFLDLSKLKPVGWYVSGQTKLTDEEIEVTYIGGAFDQEKA
jgi:hypothetical protein